MHLDSIDKPDTDQKEYCYNQMWTFWAWGHIGTPAGVY